MPSKQSTTSSRSSGGAKSVDRGTKPSAHPLRDSADALHRSARESCHQHERLSRLLALGAEEVEFAAACELAALSDRHLGDQVLRYELAAAAGKGKEDDAWWHAANALWMSAREYGRRHAASDAAGARFKRHGSAQFGEIALDYELEMSARLALKQAIKEYGQLRPDAS